MTRILLILLLALTAFGQPETLNNASIVDLSKAGLPPDIILKKIGSSRTAFDLSAAGLVDLKKAGVEDSVIAFMMERLEKPVESRSPSATTTLPYSDSNALSGTTERRSPGLAKTIAFEKSSLHPSRQALEKELMKRKDFQSTHLSILRYKEQADLFVEIGFVRGSVITHRYVYRIFDRRSGAVIGAGETTSWGSLAENLARNIAKTLTAARVGG